MLELPGVFTLVLPEGWYVTVSGKTYELIPPDRSGALHISVYENQARITSEEIARDLTARFVKMFRPEDEVEIHLLVEDSDQCRSVARFVSTAAESGETFSILVFMILWPASYLMCSCTAPVGAELVDEAEMLFASIAPIKSSDRRIFRRR